MPHSAEPIRKIAMEERKVMRRPDRCRQIGAGLRAALAGPADGVAAPAAADLAAVAGEEVQCPVRVRVVGQPDDESGLGPEPLNRRVERRAAAPATVVQHRQRRDPVRERPQDGVRYFGRPEKRLRTGMLFFLGCASRVRATYEVNVDKADCAGSGPVEMGR
ncbi:hypothetical protein ACFYSJ_36190 [Streptomyces sp. NPDC005248]|uniref:hypothetical protein n=1 Tax=Streptomyces sp. NPDC005248 TaxID=3364709 RepID=UPI003698116D